MPRPGVVAALAAREYRIASSYRNAYVVGVLLGLANLLVYYYVSKTVTSPRPAALAGAPDFFSYVAPGLALAVVVQTASLGTARRVREEQLTGGIEGWLVQPVTSLELALGLVGFAYLLSALRAAMYLVVAVAFLGLAAGSADILGAAVILGLATPAVAATGVAIAACVVVVRRGEGIVALLAFGLTALGGAYYPVSEMPGWAEAFATLTPTLHAFDGLRDALFGGSWADDAMALVIFTALALPLSVALFAAALRHLRRTGKLDQP